MKITFPAEDVRFVSQFMPKCTGTGSIYLRALDRRSVTAAESRDAVDASGT